MNLFRLECNNLNYEKCFWYTFSVNLKIGIFSSKTYNGIGFTVLLERLFYCILRFAVLLEMVLETKKYAKKYIVSRICSCAVFKINDFFTLYR